MTFLKLGELTEITAANIQSPENILIDQQILENFKKFAGALKKIAPKADDFLYFSAVMMHAAEAALLNEDGTPRLTRSGEIVKAHWDQKGGTWRWICNDTTVRPFKNSNGDIFPEQQLIKAYKKWIGKPLCIDHKSNSVDHVRGFIVDTYYDHNLKRIVALCALDRKNYPDLARKVETGYSNSVSMGTAVGQAICFDCGQVARAESDFCQHMRTKSGYGEINIDLNPLELSIVVNGADPQAKIKHIIAAANTLSNYVDFKKEELKKVAQSATMEKVNQLKNELKEAQNKLAELEQEAKTSEKDAKDTNDLAFNQSTGTIATDDTVDVPATDFSLAPPTPRFAGVKEQEVLRNLASIELKLSHMQQELNKITATRSPETLDSTSKEEIMTAADKMNKQGYFQGGGGLNEPTPGEKKYPVDPMQDDLRDNADKQMVGQKPFPDVGKVEDLYPGYDSFPTGELERKKMLARAEAEERALKRTAVLEKAKKGYFQGGGGLNEPTPGERKYPVDPMQDKLRDTADKQMVGQKPFPDVGDVDGLHPSPESAPEKDELKRKELLQRAGLKARFMKNADLGKSTWEVWDCDELRGNTLVLTASVDEITGGRAELLGETVATKEFGKSLLKNVRSLGAEKASALLKKAQMAGAPPAMDAPAAPAMPPAAEMAPPAGEPADEGKEGDPKDTLMELVDKLKDLSSDLGEAAAALTGEKSEMGEMGGLEGMANDDAKAEDGVVSTASLQEMRKNLNESLLTAMTGAVDGLKKHEQELTSMHNMYEKGVVSEQNKAFVDSIVQEAVTEAKEAMADAVKLLGAFVKYARGTQALNKQAEEVETLNKSGETMATSDTLPVAEETKKELQTLAETVDAAPADDSSGSSSEDESKADDVAGTVGEMLADDLANAMSGSTSDSPASGSTSMAASDTVSSADVQQAVEVTTPQGDKVTVPAGSKVEKVATLETKEARSELRNKLAADLKWNPVFYDFHPKGKCQPGHLDVKPQDGLEVVENLEEQHDKIMDVATAPPKVRKEAEAIQKLVSEGKLDPKDLDMLVANGVDKAAVDYWKKYFGQAGKEGSEFATELVKEHVKAQLDAEMKQYRVKLARSYELAYDMVDRDLLARDRGAISAQVDEIMKFNDEGFESFKRVIARHAPASKTGHIPQVGVLGTEEITATAAPQSLASQLEHAFSKSPRRMS